MKKAKNKDKIFNKIKVLIVIVTITIFCIETVGYAAISSLIKLNGNVTWKIDGKLLITNVTQTTLTRVTENSTPAINERQVTFNLTLSPQNNQTARAVYSVTLTNNSSFTHVFTNADIQTNFTNTNRVTTNVQVSGLTEGQRIESGSTVTFTVTITGTRRNGGGGGNNTSTGTAVITINTDALSNGSLRVNLENNTGNLVTHPIERFTINVMNTRPYGQTIHIDCGSEKVEVVDSNGGPLSDFSINASETNQFNFYLKAKDSATFGKSPYSVNIGITSSDGTILNLGNISLQVPVSGEEPEDEDAPVISNVTASKNSTDGSITVSYSGSDASAISTYYIVACKENNGNYECGDAKTSSTSSYTFTGLEYGTYMFKVYAEDEWGNRATPAEVNAATTSSGHACASTSAFYRWKVTITFDLENMYYDGSNTKGKVDVDYMNAYSFTLTTFGQNYELPNAITVSNSSGNLTAGTGYTYTQSSGAVTINASYMTDNLTVSGTATYNNTCLVEGTKIKLANGKYKNIEDIKYTDLLSVWSYETGSLTYEYPIWIEEVHETNSYQKTTFSDGTVLKTAGLHQVYSLDDNKFVNIIDDNGTIKIGTRVAKEVNGKIIPVKVVKVETIYEKVKHYFVASSIYYNIISEGLITAADQVVPGITLSNMYSFGNNIKWTNERENILKSKDALFEYKDFSMIPYYLFNGVRASEVRLFTNRGYVNKAQLMEYLGSILLNSEKVVPPIIDSNGNRLWMVTTSDDVVTNYKKYLYKEEDIYVLKEPKNKKNFNGWFNTVDGKMYQVGDKYKVIHGTHFIAK